ncbi:MAG: hypothetical protein FJX95_07960, partial [Bacteroidetes bacterium]|nr:hypothetical protein [Bacteroidota bacterium]
LSISEAINSLCQRQALFQDCGKAVINTKISVVSFQLLGKLAMQSPGALVASSVFGGAVQIYSLTRGCVSMRVKTTYSELRQLSQEYFSNSGSLVISHILISITFALPTLYIAKTFGESNLGQFATAFQLVFLPSSLLGSSIGNVYFQRAARELNSCKSIWNLWVSTVRNASFIGIPVFIFVGIASPTALPFLLGSAWADTGKVAMLVTPAAFFSFISSPVDRTCVLVGAKLYSPLWHLARMLSTLAVIVISKTLKLNFFEFVGILSFQMSLLYVVDLLCERFFAKTIDSRCFAKTSH